MRTHKPQKFISKLLQPTRVFIALMIAVLLWLFPFISLKEKTVTPIEHGVIVSTNPYTALADTGCSDVHCDPGYCCVFGACKTGQSNCGSGPPPPSPPSISASLDCSNPGTNGWCIGSLTLNLSASDPQGSAVIISGTVNGNNFTCPSGAPSCSIPITTEGTGSITYRVDASTTGLSATGSTGYQLDISTPNLNASVSGTPGTSPWYVSDATVTASASDSISGLAAIETNTDGGGWTSYSPLTISDGIHTVNVRAIDNAGNISQTSRTIQVDTITPSLSLSTSGTKGKNDWYTSTTIVTPSASDSGSGLSTIQLSADGGPWSSVGGPSSFTDGVHTYKYRAIDNAGNITETPLQYLNVDTTPPSIDLAQGTSLGEPVKYKIEDYGSGLSIYRAVIEDNGGQYGKVVWAGNINVTKIQSKILWDGKFGNDTAGVGQYMLTMRVTDMAGNESTATSYISVNLLSFLQDLSGSTPPQTDDTVATDQADSKSQTDSQPKTVVFGNAVATVGEIITTDISVTSTTNPVTNIPLDPNILWGAAAAAMLGATLAAWEEERKRKEEEERQRAAESNNGRFAAIAKAYNASLKNFKANLNQAKARGMTDTEIKELKDGVAKTGTIGASLKTTQDYVEQHAVPMPAGLSPEAQAAYSHGGMAAADWIAANATDLQTEYTEDLANLKALGDAEKANAADAARWAGAAEIAQTKEAAQQAADQVAFDHRMSEHDTTQIVSGGGKLAMPLLQGDPPPPEPQSILDIFTNWVKNLWNGNGNQPLATPVLPTAPIYITHVSTSTLLPTNTPTSTPTLTATPSPTIRPTREDNDDELTFFYGIDTIGMSKSGRQIILNAANLLGNNIAPIIKAVSPDAAFRETNGHIILIVDEKAIFLEEGKIKTGNCETKINILQSVDYEHDSRTYISAYQINIGTSNEPIYQTKQIATEAAQSIVCKTEPTLENILHEFGHTTPNHLRYDIFSNVASIPYGEGLMLDYQNGYWIRQSDGFKSGEKSLEHPITNSESSVDGYAKIEQLADMFLNWNMDKIGSKIYGFSDDEAGSARRTFIDKLIKNMLGRP